MVPDEHEHRPQQSLPMQAMALPALSLPSLHHREALDPAACNQAQLSFLYAPS